MKDKTTRQDWLEFIDAQMKHPKPEEELAYDHKEFLQKIKLYFDGRTTVCEGKVDLSYIYFRLKSILDEFIDKDFRRDLEHYKGVIEEIRDKINKEIYEIKRTHSKDVQVLNNRIKDLKKQLETEISKVKSEVLAVLDEKSQEIYADLKATFDKLNEELSEQVAKHDRDIENLKDIINNLSQTIQTEVDNYITEIKTDLETKIEANNTYIKEVEKALNDFIATKGEAGGIASLDKDGKILDSQLPDWTDDVIEIFAEYEVDEQGKLYNINIYSDFKKTEDVEGESGKIYMDITSDEHTYLFRWTGREWVCINDASNQSSYEYENILKKYNSIPNIITSAEGSSSENGYDISFAISEKNSEGLYVDGEPIVVNISNATSSTSGLMTAEQVQALENAATKDEIESLKDEIDAIEQLDDSIEESITKLEEAVEGKQDILTAGNNISINNINGTTRIDCTLDAYTKTESDAQIQSVKDEISNIENIDSSITSSIEKIENNITTINEEISGKQDKLTAGTCISIENNVISCTCDNTLFVIVTKLPETGEANKIYLVPSSTEEGNIYTEYIWVDGVWEKIGEYKADVDLSGYYTKTEIDALLVPINSSISNIETNITSIESDITTIKSDANDLKSDVNTISTKIDNINEDVTSLQKTTEDLQTQINTKQNKLTAGTGIEIHEVDGETIIYNTQGDSITNLESQIDKITSDLTSTQAEVDENSKSIASLEATTTDMSKAIDTIETDIVSINETLNAKANSADVNTIIEHLTSDIESKADSSTVDAYISNINSSIDTLKEDISTKANAADVENSISNINSSIDTLKEDISTKANAADVYTKAEIDSTVSSINNDITNANASITTNASAIEELQESKQDALTAGTGIGISKINDKTVIECTLDTTLFEVVTVLPETNIDINRIYVVPSNIQGLNNIYAEYIYVGGAWEKLGEFQAEVDLAGCYTREEVDALLVPINANITSNTQSISSLTTRVVTNESNITALETTHKSDIDSLNALISDLTGVEHADFEGVQTALAEVNTNITNLTNAVESKQDALTAGNNISINTINGTTRIDCTLDAYTKDEVVSIIQDIKDDIDGVESEITSTKTELESDIDAVSKDLDDAKTELQTNITNIENELQETSIKLQSNIDAIAKDVENIENEIVNTIEVEIEGKQDALEAGDNITIENNVISAKDTTYSAGTGISIDDNNVIECTLDTEVFIIVTELPETGEANKIYLVPAGENEVKGNIYIEWIYIGNAWEKLGEFTPEVDLSDYYTKEQVDSITSDINKSIESLENDTKDISNKIPTKVSELENDVPYLVASDLTGINSSITELSSSLESTKSELQGNIDNISSTLETTKSDLETSINNVDDAVTSLADAVNVSISNIQGNIDKKQDALEAGDNITIENNVISAKDTTYSAGTGISIDDNNIIECTLDTTLFKVVMELPTENINDNLIYVVPRLNEEGAEEVTCDEYLYVDGKWDKIGEVQVEVDLSNYYTKDETNEVISEFTYNKEYINQQIEEINQTISNIQAGEEANLTNYYTKSQTDEKIADAKTELESEIATKQDVLTAGDNITIENNVISSKDTTYSAGDNVEISEDNVISVNLSNIENDLKDIEDKLENKVDTTTFEDAINTKQDVLTAGDYIDITDNTIKVTNVYSKDEINSIFEALRDNIIDQVTKILVTYYGGDLNNVENP